MTEWMAATGPLKKVILNEKNGWLKLILQKKPVQF